MQERSKGITVLGWFIICTPLLMVFMRNMFLKTDGSFSYFPTFPSEQIVKIILSALFSLIAGIGILRLKKWARLVSLMLTACYLMVGLVFVWFFNFPLFPFTYFGIFVYSLVIYHGAIIYCLLQRNIVIQFEDNKGVRLRAKVFLSLLGMLLCCSSFLYCLVLPGSSLPISVISSLGEIIREPNPTYKITIYDLQNISKPEFATKEITIFDYKIAVPEEFIAASPTVHFFLPGRPANSFGEVNSFMVSRRSFPGVNERESRIGLLKLSDETILSKAFINGFERVGIKTPLEFEKRIVYASRWKNPFYFLLRGSFLRPGGEGEITEVTTPSWHGYVFQSYRKGSFGRDIYELECWAHEVGGQKSAEILIVTEDKNLAFQILSSLEFLKENVATVQLFKKGRGYLDAKDYFNAVLSFYNCVYRDPQNPKYLYYVALTKFGEAENGLVYESRGSLSSAKWFTQKASELDPDYLEAKELLAKIDVRLAEIDQDNKNSMIKK